MSRETGKGSDRLVIGGPARANLLPPEVGEAARGRVVRRNAVAIIVVAILVVVAGYAGAMFLAMSAQQSLDAANERTQNLLQEQSKYIEVRQVTTMLDAAAAAQRVGTSTEIDWKAYLDDIQASLPSGTLVTNVRAETATPVTSFGQPSAPLQGARIGELTFTATSVGLPDVKTWLIALAKLPGFVDASPGSIAYSESDENYQVSITMHINEDALLLRYDEEAKEAQEEAREERAVAQKAKDNAAKATTEPATPVTDVGGGE